VNIHVRHPQPEGARYCNALTVDASRAEQRAPVANHGVTSNRDRLDNSAMLVGLVVHNITDADAFYTEHSVMYQSATGHVTLSCWLDNSQLDVAHAA